MTSKESSISQLLSCNGVSKILDHLVEKYYKCQKSSIHTSSHWRMFGTFQSIIKTNNNFSLTGGGFGDYIKASMLRYLISTPSQIFLWNMLRECDSNIVMAGKTLARETGRIFSFDIARQLLTINLLVKQLGSFSNLRVAIIGDGYGTLGTLFKLLYPTTKIIYINLGRTLVFDLYYSALVHPSAQHILCTTIEEGDKFDRDFLYVEAENVFSLKPRANLFINIASMQEMNPTVIQWYFDLIRGQEQDVHFYCCNRIEKKLPDGTITRFHEYDWRNSDEIIFDEICPWHQIAPLNKPPFVYKFDGPIHHRLVKISSLR